MFSGSSLKTKSELLIDEGVESRCLTSQFFGFVFVFSRIARMLSTKHGTQRLFLEL